MKLKVELPSDIEALYAAEARAKGVSLERYIVDYQSTAETQWINRIQSRLHQSSSETLKQRLAIWKESGLGELALIIATRTAVLRHILLQLTKEMSELEQELRPRKGDVREAIEGGHGIRVGDSPFRLMLFAHAFLFESKAASEFIRDFVKCFFKKHLRRNPLKFPAGEAFRGKWSSDRMATWLHWLKNERDFLLHTGGTWPVLEAVNETYERFDLVLLKRISYARTIDEKDTIPFDRLREILSGFQRAVAAIERWLINEIGDFEKRESGGAA